MNRVGFCSLLWLGGFFALRAEAQQIWEFSPYRVQVWVACDWSLDLPEQSHARLLLAINDSLEAAFKSAWSVETLKAPPHLEAAFSRGLDALTVEQLARTELELVVAKDSEEANTVRSFEAALEQLTAIAITRSDLQSLTNAAAPYKARHPNLEKLISKCTSVLGSPEEVAKAIESKQTLAALVRQPTARLLGASIRSIPTTLPWQTQHLFRDLDKVIFVSIAKHDNQYAVSSRELDCPMRFVGPVMQRRTSHSNLLPACVRQAIIAAFAPVTRVEDTTLRSAQLTLRSGGLIVDRENPANLHLGDVLQPIMRRDDRNGVPSLLEPLPWTFAVVTKSDGIRLDANVYSGVSGALQGRRNRRTQKVALKVRPTGSATDMKIVVRQSPNVPQIGCEIYRRDLATEQLTLLGRTDWRGTIMIPATESSQKIIPEAVRLARMAAQKAAEVASAPVKDAPSAEPKKEQAPPAVAKGASESTPSSASAIPPVEAVAQKILTDPNDDSQAISLRQPLTLLYVKSGETVLARLPMVPGLTPEEIAELPSDARRLEAEAFISGFQSDVFDIIGLRSLYHARARKRIGENKIDEAKQLVAELRGLPTFTEVSDQLEGLQRKMLDESSEQIPPIAKARIDRMFQNTRDMVQKYLQEDLAVEIDRLISQAGQKPITPADDSASASLSETGASASKSTEK